MAPFFVWNHNSRLGGVRIAGWRVLCGAICASTLAFAASPSFSQEKDLVQMRKKGEELNRQGNYKDAYELFSQLALDPADDPMQVGQDLKTALACLRAISRTNEVDALRDKAIAAHPNDWRLLFAAAETLIDGDHTGFIIAGEFERGGHRGGGRQVNAEARDRIRALQLMVQAMKKAEGEKNKNALAGFYQRFAEMILRGRQGPESWRLQYLSDLTALPDYDEWDVRYLGWRMGPNIGAPADEDGNPIFYPVPKSFEAAKNDGERWRWALAQTVEYDPKRENAVDFAFADFLQQQFDVQTLAGYSALWRQQGEEEEKGEAAIYSVHTLGENETIARLATGIKRFNLPGEFNFIRLFQRVANEAQDDLGVTALERLAQIFENRRQYDKAAGYWREVVERASGDRKQNAQKRLDQIVNNWGQLEPVMSQSAGKGATVDYRFRNGARVEFEARAIKVRELLADAKDYIRSKPGKLDYRKIDIGDVGMRLVYNNETKYVGDKVAAWSLDLTPRPGHFDRRITVTTPLQKAGAYLLTAQMKDGNVSRIILWLNDTVIVKKPLDKKTLYFVADARTGEPVPGASLEFFGYRQGPVMKGNTFTNQYQVLVLEQTQQTDADGQIITDESVQPQDYQWIVTATAKGGPSGERFAYLGFTSVWYGDYYDQEYNQTKVFTITDRPVYRPGQPVKFKSWVRHAKYDQEDTSDFANQTFKVQIHNPKGDVVFEKDFTTDAYGGLNGEYELPKDATLGVYGLQIVGHGGGSFRVEEYKKPEFEVLIDAPSEPVMLGEKIPAKIKANYYFGAPVAKAKVKYKVLRSSFVSHWYPVDPWDWFYGPGYWWFGYDYDWYPGWHKWGCVRPIPWWWSRPTEQPEVVLENEVEIGEDGTVKFEIDTALAKAIHGDLDHRYEITAEVTDQSRRTIVGKGAILVARDPFKVYAWVDRGHYRVGDTIGADFSAQTLDNKPVKGKGELNLLKIKYGKDMKPVETSAQKWDLDTNDEGRASVQIKASEAGQYRLSYKVADAKGHTIEGGYVFTIAGEGFDGSQFRFNDIEIVTDKRDYAPGDKVQLMVNTNRVGATVLLFTRPSNGVYLPPKIVRMKGKSVLEEIEVTKKDMPNFFVEAVTIYDGRIHTEARDVAVPPEQRILNIEVKPSKEEYKPGEKATVALKLTDQKGEPFAGSMVLTMYDKALEYISGGSNVPEIKAFFWKWRRSHHPNTESNLERWFNQLFKQGELPMADLGVFGGAVEVEEEGLALSDKDRSRNMVNLGFVAGRGGSSRGDIMMKSLEAAPTAMPEGAPMEAKDQSAAPMVDALRVKPKDGGGAGGAEVQPMIRTKFADAAYWDASLTTDADGFAQIELTMPENLTGWKIRTWAMGHGTKVGEADALVTTKKNLLLRLQAPRFFVEKDEVVLSANIHNYLKDKKKVRAVLELDGGCLEAMDKTEKTIEVAAGGEERVDWRVKVVKEGEAAIRMKALTDEESDAMEMKFPVYVHGMEKMVPFSGWIKPEGESATVSIDVPKERRIDESRLEVRYSPTLAAAMVDALPYMVDYPYGCTEQTLSRFLPTVITQKVLLGMGIDLKSIRDKKTNLNAQELGDAKERAKQWQRYRYPNGEFKNPVFDEDEVRAMVKEGVEALTQMQLADGGWGWFSGYGEQSWPHTTAYVVHGLQIARENDADVPGGVIERGVEWLKRYQEEQVRLIQNWPKQKDPRKDHAGNLDAFVYMVLVDAGVKNKDMRELLYRDRNELSVYAKAMFGIALDKEKEIEKRDMIVRNIEQFLVRDDENQTAYLNLGAEGYWWYWYGSEYEAHAYYLKLLARVEPAGWKAPYLVKYLLNNRKHATYWNSTRDTSLCVEAFADTMKASHEDKPNMTVEILLDGKKQKEVQITPENLFTFDNKFVLVGDAVESGKHAIELRKKGTGPLYFNAYLTYFSLEDFITKAGLEVKVDRAVYKLTPEDKTVKARGSRGQAVDQKVEKYKRTLLKSDATLKSGDLVEVELTIESKNDYEYLVFEDMKAAGFEPVEVRSGYNGNDMGAYVEYRDNRVVFFVRALARGKHSVSYRERAEIPGKFSALPARGYAMYAPELRGNSDEIKLAIED